jgi:hypothetical protein
MSDTERAPIVRRAIEELQRLPAADRQAVRRIVVAAAAARVAPADDEVIIDSPPRRRRLLTFAGVAAALIVGFTLNDVWHSRAAVSGIAAPPVAGSPATAGASMQPVATGSADAFPLAHQFVFRSRTAQRVSVVGDFNRWNAASAPMHRAAGGDLWSVTVALLPGRHTYGFMVDDSLFVLDPRALRARDADLGAEGSVLIVGRP